MTPKSPLSGAGGGTPPFPHPPMDEGGAGKVKKRAMGGAMDMPPGQGAMGQSPGTQYKRGGRAKKRAMGGGMGFGKKAVSDRGASVDRSSGGRLSSGERGRLPSSDFALPGKGDGKNGKGSGSYPIPNASHARNALARVAQHGDAAQKAAVRRKVHEKFPDIGQS